MQEKKGKRCTLHKKGLPSPSTSPQNHRYRAFTCLIQAIIIYLCPISCKPCSGRWFFSIKTVPAMPPRPFGSHLGIQILAISGEPEVNDCEKHERKTEIVWYAYSRKKWGLGSRVSVNDKALPTDTLQLCKCQPRGKKKKSEFHMIIFNLIHFHARALRHPMFYDT